MADVAASIITLVGLYKVCVEAFDYISLTRSKAADLEHFNLKLNIEKCRLYAWGYVLGLSATSTTSTSPLLLDPFFQSTLEQALKAILKTLTDSQTLASTYGFRQIDSSEVQQGQLQLRETPTDALTSAFGRFRIDILGSAAFPRAIRTIKWVTYDRERFAKLIFHTKTLIDGLQSITAGIISVQQQEKYVSSRISRIDNIETLNMITEVCESVHQVFSDAASDQAEIISRRDTLLPDVAGWLNQTNSGMPRDSVLDAMESWTLSDFRRNYLALLQEKESLMDSSQVGVGDRHPDAITTSNPRRDSSQSLVTVVDAEDAVSSPPVVAGGIIERPDCSQGDTAAASMDGSVSERQISLDRPNPSHHQVDTYPTTGVRPPMLIGATTTILGDDLYVFGGRYATGEPNFSSDLYVLNLHTKVWTKVEAQGDVPIPRYFHSVCAWWPFKLVCFGGIAVAETAANSTKSSSDNSQISAMNDTYIFDCGTSTWERWSFPYAPTCRYAHCATILDTSATDGPWMMIVGGQDSSNAFLGSINVLNLRSRRWTHPISNSGDKHGVYNSLVAPISSNDLPNTMHGRPNGGDEAFVLIFSNRNFRNTQHSLQVFAVDGWGWSQQVTDETWPMGMRFPSGDITGHHLIVGGIYLTSSRHEQVLWTMDLRTMQWRSVGTDLLGTGSWNRGQLWKGHKAFVYIGKRDGDFLKDYDRRRLNFDDVCFVDLRGHIESFEEKEDVQWI